MAGRNNNEEQSILCCWNDHGLSCRHKGMRSMSTFGGPWYCREHYYKLMGYPDMEAEGLHGNELPKTPLHSMAVDEARKKLKPTGSTPMAKWLPKPRREPGQDDEEIAA